MMQKSTTFTTIFLVKKCYFNYDFLCKNVPLSLQYAKNNLIIHTYYTLLGNFLVKGKLDRALLVNLNNSYSLSQF
jgi:hypothetical protein